jgi:isoleucyl-tRNA synthetase
MPLSKDILKQVSESYRKIRNTLKFLLTNVSDFKPEDSLPYEKLELVDKYMLIKLNDFIKQIKSNYDSFDFGEVYRNVLSYVSNTLSSFYLDFTKDILYIEDPKSNKRLSVQTVFYQILLALVKLLTPILPHTMSEAYDTLPYKEEKDVYLTDMPEYVEYNDPELVANFESFMKYRDIVLKSLEEARANKVIGKSFNAKLTLTLDAEAKKVFEPIKEVSHQLLIVSQIEFVDGSSFDVKVEAAQGEVCSRCWMIVPQINEDELCPRCAKIVKL